MRVELTRLCWRRAVLLLLLFAVVVPTVICIARLWSTRPVSEDELAAAATSSAGEIRVCENHPRRYGLPNAAPQRCEDLIVGWQTGRQPLSLTAERMQGPGVGVVAVLTALLLLLGTTFIGHDWNTGSMSNQLLFEPRRGRIWAAKALVVTLVALVAAAVVSTAYWLATWAFVEARGLPVTGGALTDTLAFGLRGAGFAAAAALGGFALTMLFRSTVATIGVLFAVSLAGGVLLAVLGVGEQWQPVKNVAAIVKNGTYYYVDVPQRCFSGVRERTGPVEGSECDQTRRLPASHGLGYFGSALVLTCGASAASYRRRDVP
jgi:hypothetical protein